MARNPLEAADPSLIMRINKHKFDRTATNKTSTLLEYRLKGLESTTPPTGALLGITL